MNQIARPIGKADLEFYESHMIEVAAKALSGRSEDEWARLSGKTRTNWRAKALRTMHAVLADQRVVERLPKLAENLASRI